MIADCEDESDFLKGDAFTYGQSFENSLGLCLSRDLESQYYRVEILGFSTTVGPDENVRREPTENPMDFYD